MLSLGQATAPLAADSKAQIAPACLAQVRARLGGPKNSTSIRPTLVKARQLGAKRLIFRRGDVLLVVDHAVLHAQAVAFLKEIGAKRFPEEARMLQQFLKQLERADEAEINESQLTARTRERLPFRLADALDAGAFEIRTPARMGKNASSSKTVLRLDWSYYCGQLCAGEGRVFVTESCQELVSVTDMIS